MKKNNHSNRKEINGIVKNEIYEVEVTDFNNLGNGVARINGVAVFVLGGVIGDFVKVKIIKIAKDYTVARVEEIIKPSEKRRIPDCKHFGFCGGCVYLCLTQDSENELKRKYVENAFRKARLNVTAEETVCKSADGYRCKVEYPISKSGKVGLYARGSHNVIEVSDCQKQARVFDGICEYIGNLFESLKIPVYDETSGKGIVRHIYNRYAKGTGQIMVVIVINADDLPHKERIVKDITGKFPEIASIFLNINKENTNVVLGDKNVLLYGSEYIEDIICKKRFRFSPMSFCQVNHEGMEVLYQKVYELANVQKGDTVCDLYCGVGSIGLCVITGAGKETDSEMLKTCRLSGVEIIPEAIENAKYNAKINGVENADFICGDADIFEIENSDIVILDPPRKGCGTQIIERVAKISPRRVVYVSCNPDTLARDCAQFNTLGYEIESGKVYPVNMFPGTGHVECVCALVKTAY